MACFCYSALRQQCEVIISMCAISLALKKSFHLFWRQISVHAESTWRSPGSLFGHHCNTVDTRTSSGRMSGGPPVLWCSLSRGRKERGARAGLMANGAVRAPGYFVRKWPKKCREQPVRIRDEVATGSKGRSGSRSKWSRNRREKKKTHRIKIKETNLLDRIMNT